MKLDYFVSLANEICVRDLRLKKLISNSYRVGSFPFSATAFRAVLQNFIPEHLGLGQGVVLGSDEKNFLSEILLYKKNSFPLYKEGDLLVLPAEAILASIFIRSDLSSINSNLEDWLGLSKEISGISAYFSWDSGVLGLDRAEGLLKKEKEYLGDTLLIPNPESLMVQDEESLNWEKARLSDFLASDNPALAALLFRLHQFLISHPYLQETSDLLGAPALFEGNDSSKLAAVSTFSSEKIEDNELPVEEIAEVPAKEEVVEQKIQEFSASQLFSVNEEFEKDKEEEVKDNPITAKLDSETVEIQKKVEVINSEEEVDPISYLDSVLESESGKTESLEEVELEENTEEEDKPETELEPIDEVQAEKEEIEPLVAVETEVLESVSEKITEEQVLLEEQEGEGEEEIVAETEIVEEEKEAETETGEEEEIVLPTPVIDAETEIKPEPGIEAEPETEVETVAEDTEVGQAEAVAVADSAVENILPEEEKVAEIEDQKIDFISGMPIEDFDSSPAEEEITPISTDLATGLNAEELLAESKLEQQEEELISDVEKLEEVLVDEKAEDEATEEQLEEILPVTETEIEADVQLEEAILPLADREDKAETEPILSTPSIEEATSQEDLLEEGEFVIEEEAKEEIVEEEEVIDAEKNPEEELNLEELLAGVSLEESDDKVEIEEEVAEPETFLSETKEEEELEMADDKEADEAPLFDAPIIEEIKDEDALIDSLEEEEIKLDDIEPITESPIDESQETPKEEKEEEVFVEKEEILSPLSELEELEEAVQASEEEEKAPSIDPVQKSTLASEVKALSMDAPPIPRKSGLEGKFIPKNRRNMGKKRTPGMGPMKNHASTISPKDRASLDLNKPDSKRAKKAQLYLQENEQGNYPVHLAVINNDLKALKLILREGEQTELKNKKGYTPLHFAAELNLIEIALVLLEQGANVNSRTFIYDAPIHLAVLFDNHEMVRVLIEHGAEVEVRNNRGNTPMHRAARFGSYKSAKLLIDNFADIHARMERDLQPLHLAAWYGNNDMVQLFIDEGAELNAVNSDGNTALHFAAFNGQVKIIKTLINNKADTSLENLEGETYLQGINEGYQGQMTAILN